MADPVKKKRIRASDILKSSRSFGESKYDFSKIVELKGATGRDVSKKGRPAGITGVSKGTATSSSIDTDVDVVCSHVHEPEESELGDVDVVLSTDETYLNLLKQNCGIYCTDDLYKTFVLLDFDKKKMQLKASQYVFVSRKAMSFIDEVQWVYSCSCDPATLDLIECCDERMDVPFNGFKERNPGCIHTATAEKLLQSFDIQNEIFPILASDAEEVLVDNQEEITELGDGKFLVNVQNSPGIVYQSDESVKCLTCNSCLVNCKHLEKFISKYVDNFTRKNRSSSYQQRCYSTKRIPFVSNIQMQNIYKMPFEERFLQNNGILELIPEIDVCDNCGNQLEMLSNKRTSNVFVQNQIFEASVSTKKCIQCDKDFHYDGFSNCVINMGRNIICHEILRKFMNYFLTGKTTIFTDYTVLRKTFKDSGYSSFDEKLSYADYKEAWYAFLKLLDIDFQDGFHCPDCGPDPDTVVMDATSVAFRKELLSWSALFSSDNDKTKPYDSIYCNRVKERTMFSKFVRQILLDYIKPAKGIAKEQKDKALNLIKIENENTDIMDLINHIFNEGTVRGDRLLVKPVWRDFVKVLASTNPLCSFLPPSLEFFSFLEDILSRGRTTILQDDTALKTVQTTVPVLFDLLTNLKKDFPFELFRKCLPYLQQKVFDPFLGDIMPSEEAIGDDELGFFPSLPKTRKRGYFTADKKSTKTKDDTCTKLSKGHRSLLPGVFTLFCPHGICYGFEVMKLHESVDVPFTLLRTRFKQAPKLVVYDNACSLQVYCLNRDPTFFMETEFRVDGLHYKNHTACGPSFELKRYPQHMLLNSQVVEQSNSRLQRLKGCLSYMTQHNFMNHCKFYLWGQNQEVISHMDLTSGE